MAKQQAPVVSSDDEEVIFDLTEIVQKGKAPLVSKPDVDFDSALSDLMGKTPAMKLDETPELEALFSGMDDVAPKRTLTFAEDDELDEPEAPEAPYKAVTNTEDVDSLVTSLVEKSGKHKQPAADDVDSLLDSLMDDLNPPSTKGNNLDQDISDEDLDDLLSSIEQDSKQTPKAASEPKPPADLDDLLAGLDFAAPDLKPAAKPQPAPKADSEPKPPADLDDLLAGLDFAAPDLKPAAKPQPAAKTVDSIDDLLAGLDNLAKPAPVAPAAPVVPGAPGAPERTDDFDMAEFAVASKKLEGRGIPEADLDDLLAGLDNALNPAKNAADKKERVDFGDLATMLGGVSDSDEDGDPDGESAAANQEAAKSDDLPDGPVSFDKPSFNANDFDDLDALFAGKKAAPAAAVRGESAHISEAPTKQPSNAELELSKRLTELAERVEQVEAERNALQERVTELENRPASEPQQDAPATMLEEGSPFCTQLMELVRAAVAAEMQALASRVDASAQKLSEMEARAVSAETKLAEVADMAAQALASTEKSQMPEAPEMPQPASLVAADLEPLAERLNALEGVVVRQGELDIQAEKLDVLEERVNTLEGRVNALNTQNTPADLLEIPTLTEHPQTPIIPVSPDPAAKPEEITKLDQRLATLEARPYVPLETIQGAFDQMGDQLNAPLQQFQNRIAQLEQRLGDDALPRLAGDLLPFMSASIDKAAAASAAKALREELEALMSEVGDDSADNEPGVES